MPVYVDLDMATDDPYVAASKQFRVCFGEMRLDSSLVAGTRYDANVTGFRLEGELGFDARPAAWTGCIECVNDIIE